MDLMLFCLFLLSIVIFLSVLELIRRNRLKERYSLLWLFSSVILVFFSLSREMLHALARFVGIKYPPSLIFLLGLLFLIIINIHFTSVISELYEKNKMLAQELALLKESVKKTGKSEGSSLDDVM